MLTDPYLKRLAEIESGGDRFARNPNSSAKGLFQFIDSTGKQYGLDQVEFGTDDYTAREIEAVNSFTQDNRNALRKALGREPTNGELYLAHQQGAGGAIKMLSNPDARAVDVLGRDQVLLNGGDEKMAAMDFANKWTSKFDDLDGGESSTMIGDSGSDTLTFNLELPDGRIIEGIPEGTTKEQIREKLIAQGIDIDGMEAPVEETMVQEEMPYSEKSFSQRFQDDINERATNMQSMLDSRNNGEQSSIETNLQLAGQVVGLGRDAVANAFVSGARGLSALTPDFIEKPIKKGISDGINRGLDSPISSYSLLPAPALEAIGLDRKSSLRGVIDSAGRGYRDFAQANPRAARNIEATANLGLLAGPISPVGRQAVASSTQTMGKTGRLVRDETKAVRSALKPEQLTSKDLTKQARAAYDIAKAKGGTVKASVVDDFIDTAKKDIAPKTEAGKIFSGSERGVVDDVLNNIEGLRGRPIDLDEFQEIDEMLGEMISDEFTEGRLTKQGVKLSKVQQTLRDKIENATVDDIEGSADGFEALKEGRRLWTRQAKLRDIEKIITRAELMDNPKTGIRTGFRTLVSNPKKLRGYSDAEIKAMKQAAKTGVVDDLLRPLTSRLPSIIGLGSGNPALALGLNAGNTAMRSAADNYKMGQAQKLMGMIATGEKPKGFTQRLGDSGNRYLENSVIFNKPKLNGKIVN